MSRRISKLFDMEFDEISVVDRPANQGGLIAIAKSDEDQEGLMNLYDSDGSPVSEDELVEGDVVYDTEGNEYEFVVDDEDVEKAMAVDAAGTATRVGSALVPSTAKRPRFLPWHQSKAGYRAKGAYPEGTSRAYRFGGNVANNKTAYAAGASGVGGVGAGVGITALHNRGDHVTKSLGDEVLESLSKAATEFDRDEIIAKALDEVEIVKSENEELRKALEFAEDMRITDAFISKAAEYNLPVSPEILGPILKSVAEVLSDEELDVLDALFNSVGDALYNEIGYVGDTDNTSVLDAVNSYADELVGKSDLSNAEAFVTLMEANPAAYDAYLAENGR